MELFEIRVACPRCGSLDVTYTCEPKCCFNHLCGNCYGTFELSTTLREGAAAAFEPPVVTRDSLSPTAACARCGSVSVFLAGGERPQTLAVCVQCRSLLTLHVQTT